MKQFLLYIILFSFGVTAMAAPLLHCKKRVRQLVETSVIGTQAASGTKDPTFPKGDLCATSTFVFVAPTNQAEKILLPSTITLKSEYLPAFISPYFTSPPFAPPRLVTV